MNNKLISAKRINILKASTFPNKLPLDKVAEVAKMN
jgi:hypothetical protein